MSHEVSETIEGSRGGAYNVYGGTQYPLSPVFGFERARYDSIPQAVNAAQWRSRMGGGPEGGQSPAYGFQPQPQPEYIGFINKLLDVLSDPRNQWMGTGMMGGTIKGVGKLRNFFADKEAARMGGFRPSLHDMKTASPDIVPTGPNQFKGSIGNEKAWNDAYIGNVKMGNDAVEALQSSDPLLRTVANEMYRVIEHSKPEYAEQINQTMVGRQQLADLNNRAMTQTEGPPPEMIRRLFGFER